VLYTTASLLQAPISTITVFVLGAGAKGRFNAVRQGVAGNIVTAWVITLSGSGAVAAPCHGVAHFLIAVAF
jgi:inorganic phosphate transporter, PiT family